MGARGKPKAYEAADSFARDFLSSARLREWAGRGATKLTWVAGASSMVAAILPTFTGENPGRT